MIYKNKTEFYNNFLATTQTSSLLSSIPDYDKKKAKKFAVLYGRLLQKKKKRLKIRKSLNKKKKLFFKGLIKKEKIKRAPVLNFFKKQTQKNQSICPQFYNWDEGLKTSSPKSILGYSFHRDIVLKAA